jgi:hypothetical protein
MHSMKHEGVKVEMSGELLPGNYMYVCRVRGSNIGTDFLDDYMPLDVSGQFETSRSKSVLWCRLPSLHLMCR